METFFLYLPSNTVRILKNINSELETQMSIHEKNKYLHYLKCLKIVDNAWGVTVDTIPYDKNAPWYDLSKCLEKGLPHLFLYSLNDGFEFLNKLDVYFEDEQWMEFLLEGAKIVVTTSSILLLEKYPDLHPTLETRIIPILELAPRHQKASSLVRYMEYLFKNFLGHLSGFLESLSTELLVLLINHNTEYIFSLSHAREQLANVFEVIPERFNEEMTNLLVSDYSRDPNALPFIKSLVNNQYISLYKLTLFSNYDLAVFIFDNVDEERITIELLEQILTSNISETFDALTFSKKNKKVKQLMPNLW